jgi:hypothetical protein
MVGGIKVAEVASAINVPPSTWNSIAIPLKS